jgi:hypothetical protein
MTVLDRETLETLDTKTLKVMGKAPTYKVVCADILFKRAQEAEATAEARRLDILENGTTILGIAVSYEELLHLATLSEKKWYGMPENNIVAALVEQVADALAGIQSREANALKEAIANLQK